MYAATHPYTVDENGNRKYVYCHWGVVDENKKFIPGKRYVFASLEERERLIFPDDWDMSEAKRLSGAKQPGRPAYTDADKNRFYGDIWLLEQVADKTSLRSDLKQVFENYVESVNSLRMMPFVPWTQHPYPPMAVLWPTSNGVRTKRV